MSANRCFHCQLPVPAGVDFSLVVDGVPRPMCCIGCEAVARAIVDGGLEKFYRYRSRPARRAAVDGELGGYDLPAVYEDLISVDARGLATVELAVADITCAACAWLIEHRLHKLPAVEAVAVNVTRHRCRVQWRLADLPLSKVLAAIASIGYRVEPADESRALASLAAEQRRYVLRLGVAGIGMMQAGMLAIALYAGAFQGIEQHWVNFLRWISLLVATPVVMYSAQPFFLGAWRSARCMQLTMDVPIALAIALAYVASLWATVTQAGEVYFDAVSMLTFFLLLGRFFEMRVRYRNELTAGRAARSVPLTALRVNGASLERVPVKSLRVGEIIQIGEGDTLPADGVVVSGYSQVVEAMLTGEQQPVGKGCGDMVSAGTVNTNNRLRIQVSAVGRATRLSAILSMLDAAAAEKPRQVAVADRLAGWFVGLVLVVAALVFALWWWFAPERALWVTLSVLVVTCPCALSLATPVALAVVTGRLQRQGFLVRRGHVLQTLHGVTRVILDKTGTLTTGKLAIQKVLMPSAGHPQPHSSAQWDVAIGPLDARILDIAAALEQGCRHPIAMALNERATPVHALQLKHTVGGGVSGVIDGELYALGKPAFITQVLGFTPAFPELECSAQGGEDGCGGPPRVVVYLASRGGLVAALVLVDALRPGAGAMVQCFAARRLAVELLSGDRTENVSELATMLGIRTWHANSSPADKLARIRSCQAAGDVVLMVGDGINDVPVLSGADISVAVGDTTDFTRLAADAVLMTGNLHTLVEAVDVAHTTALIVRQNMWWAIFYNVSALPLAMAGWVPPWAAAIGMSASSLLVVVNALRLRGGKIQRDVPDKEAGPASAMLI